MANSKITDLSALTASSGDEIPVNRAGADGKVTAGAIAALASPLTAATTNMTFFVRTDGSNSNTGLTNTATGAFLTAQKAFDTAAGYDWQYQYVPTIKFADGTYATTARSIKVRPLVRQANGEAFITGNTTTPTNVVLNTGNRDVLEFFGDNDSFSFWAVRGLSLVSSQGTGIYCRRDVSLYLDDLDFNCADACIALGEGCYWYGGYDNLVMTVSRSSNMASFISVAGGSAFAFSMTVTINNPVTITNAWAIQYGGELQMEGFTWNNAGNVTGRRANLEKYARYYAGPLPDALPGTAAARFDNTVSVLSTGHGNVNYLSQKSTTQPSTNNLRDGCWGVIKDSSSGNVFLAYNDGGVIKQVVLATT